MMVSASWPMSVLSLAPLASMAASLGGAALLGATGRTPALRDACAIGVAALQLLCVLAMLPAVMAGEVLSVEVSRLVGEVGIAFRVDALGLVFALTASALWVVTTVYSVGYLRALASPAQTRFHLCVALTMTATMGVAFAANLLTMYLFYELMTVATYFLVIHDQTEEAYAGGRKYLAYHLGTSIAFLLPAVIMVFVLSGSFDFVAGGVFSESALEEHRTLLIVVFLLFMAGSAKAAIMPLHGWLPSAMVAPVPVSALLHAVAVVNAGAFGVLRVIFDVFGPNHLQALGLQTFTLYLACFTILAASLYALKLDNLKALLAYSTIGQLSYIVLGAVLFTADGMAGGVSQIVFHGVAKTTLFLCAGSIYLATHMKYLSDMSGVGRQMPWTMLAFSIAAFSMIGLPGTAGFVSKWLLVAGSFQAGEVVALVVLGLSTLLSATYYLRAIGILGGIRRGGRHRHGSADASSRQHETPFVSSEVSGWIVGPLLVTAAATLVLGLMPEFTVMPLIRLLHLP
jgi:multicomponent Na+:H+ antiporter subunit D